MRNSNEKPPDNRQQKDNGSVQLYQPTECEVKVRHERSRKCYPLFSLEAGSVHTVRTKILKVRCDGEPRGNDPYPTTARQPNRNPGALHAAISKRMSNASEMIPGSIAARNFGDSGNRARHPQNDVRSEQLKCPVPNLFHGEAILHCPLWAYGGPYAHFPLSGEISAESEVVSAIAVTHRDGTAGGETMWLFKSPYAEPETARDRASVAEGGNKLPSSGGLDQRLVSPVDYFGRANLPGGVNNEFHHFIC